MKHLLALLLLLPAALLGAEPAKRELIAQLFEITDVRATIEKLRKENVALVRNLLETQNARTEFANNPTMRRLLDRVMVKYEAYSQEFMGWPRWEAKYVTLYEEAFTDEQLRETVAFLKSDAGRAWVGLQAKALSQLQEDALKQEQARQAKIKQIMDETVAEVKAEMEAEAAGKKSPEKTKD